MIKAKGKRLMGPDEFEQIVSRYYGQLYKFAFSLTGVEADACDLTQQTFYIWATKNHQLLDRSKVKAWLFTILHREFLKIRKRTVRFPHFELSEALDDLPTISPEVVSKFDLARALQFLGQVREPFRVALTLFYLEDYSYEEIANILEVPIGTVRSRISRGVAQLQRSIQMGVRLTPPNSMLRPITGPRSRMLDKECDDTISSLACNLST